MLPLCTPKLKTQHVSFAECLSARHSLQLLAKYKYCSAQSTYTTAGATLLLTIYTSNTTTSLLSSLYEYTQLTALLAVSVPSPPELSATYDGSTIISGASQVGENQGESSGNVKSSHVGSSNIDNSNSGTAMDTTSDTAAADTSKGINRSDSSDNNENPDDADDDVPVVPAEVLQDDDTSCDISTAKDAASATITAATASKSSTTTSDSTTAKAAAAAAALEAFQCMVFVERRTTARIVCDLLRMVFRLRQGAPRQRPAFACSYVVGASLAHGRGATPLSTAAVDDEQLRIALAAAAAEQAKQDALETRRAARALRDFRTGKLQLLVTTDACSE
eukprot:18880-Heterococcus_DN1.PRE.1